MKTTSILKLAAAPCALAAAFCAAPALAQSPTAECVDADADGACDAPATADSGADRSLIIVTGSRIPQPNLESANPVTVVSGEEFFESGNVNVGDQLNDLPQLRSTFSQQNSTASLGTRGINLLDLRGLGTQRTLVLVNGRRHVPGDVLNFAVSPDVNTFPNDLIERVDVLTGGASSIYGSDAIAGVVNFILKDDFEGVQLRGQTGVSRYGDAGNQYVSLLAGKNFADGRGNVAVDLEFAHNGRAYASGRPNLRQNNAFVIVDSDPAGTPNGSDGNPDRVFFRDIRSATISLGGMVAVNPGAGAPCGTAGGTPFTCAFQFLPDGTLIPQTGNRVGLGPNGSFIGGNGYTARDGQLLTLFPDLKRYSANLIGHFEVSPAFVPFVEAKYVRTDAFGSQSGPFFSQGTTQGDPGNRERVRLDNPFLSTQARALLAAQFTASTVNPNTGAALVDTLDDDGNVISTAAQNLEAQRAAIAAGSFRFNLRRNFLDLGIRDEEIRRETYRIVGGVRGDFNDDWHYEVSLNYGEHREKNRILNNVNVQRYLLAVDATRNGAGQVVCRSQLNPAGTLSYTTGNPLSAGDDPQLAADIAACVPLNPFGSGNINPAARNYVTVDSRATGKITQFDALAFISGDSSQLFELPGGPIGFSIGGEYRRETNRYDLDDLTQAGYAFYNAIPSFVSPAFEVKEAFGEIRIPILKDTPFFEELTLSGSGRVADYKGATGTVFAYGGEAVWKPVRDITLRGTYSRSVRAPNLNELFSAQGQNFSLPSITDPCSARNLAAGSSNRVANCAAAGRPANFDFVYSQSLEIVSGGNPALREEKSDSYTAGIVLQPRWIPGLSISADYYDITVNDVIASVEEQDILNLCYDSPTLDNPFCGLFQRAGATGGPNGEIPFQVLEASLLQSNANFAKFKVRGVDTQVAYRHDFGWGQVDINAVWTHILKNEQFTDPATPTFKDVLKSELGDPDDQVNLNASVKRGKLTVGYQLRWIDHQYLNTFEDYNSVNGDPPQNADYAEIKRYPDVFYHDARVAYDVTDRFNLYVGVDNITDRKPPFGLSGVGEFSGIFDNRGRYYYTGVVAKF
ncbi:MAG: TonB-dependent receptor [Novosphingobium sp.]